MKQGPEPTALSALVPDLLARSWVTLDKTRPNIGTLHLMADLALLVDAADLHAEITAVLDALSDSAFIEGVITNTDPEVLIAAGRRHRRADEVDARQPAYDQASVAAMLKAGAAEQHLSLALEGRWEDAYREAADPRCLEDIAAIQALYGSLDDAAAEIHLRLPPERLSGPLTVLTVEAARRGEIDRAKASMAELEEVNGYAVLQACLGWLGREPWGGYPLPDW